MTGTGRIFLYNGIERLALWFDNPNKAAAFLACLSLVCLWLMRSRHGKVRLFGYISLVLSLITLAMTFSRGGLMAFAAGSAALFLFSRREKEKATLRRLATAGVFAVFAVTVVCLGFGSRIVSSAHDRSVLNRFDVWRSVPSMIRAAPCGWGEGESGRAYMNWFQPLERRERYRTLVNGHFTKLVEYGGFGRFVYVFSCLGVFLFGLLHARRCGNALPLSLWTAVFTADMFSTVTEAKEIYLLPVVSSFAWIGVVRRYPVTFAVAALSALFLAGSAVLVLSAGAGGASADQRADACGVYVPRPGVVETGTSRTAPGNWLVADGDVLGGNDYPRGMRRDALKTGLGSWGIVEDVSLVPADARGLVLCGRHASAVSADGWRWPRAKKVFLISPSFDVTRVRPKLPSEIAFRAYYGEFSSDCPQREHADVEIVSGAESYIPSWPRILRKFPEWGLKGGG